MIIVVDDGAARASDAGSGGDPTAATALSPPGLLGAASGRSGWLGRLSDRLQSGGDGTAGGSGRGVGRLGVAAAAARGGGRRGPGCGRLALSDAADGAGNQGRAGDRVVDGAGVRVEENARVVGAVERGAGDAAGRVAAATRHAQVDALRVRLSAVGARGAVEGNDLVPENVVTGPEVRWNLDEPAITIRPEVVGGPGASVAVIAGTVNLEPPEGLLVDRLAITIACRQVVDDRADMALGPLGGPYDANLVTSADGGVAASGGSRFVADDIGCAEVVGLNETVVLLSGTPADHCRRIGLVPVGCRIIVLVVDAVDNDVADVAMRCDKGSACQGGENSGCLGHVDSLTECKERKGADSRLDSGVPDGLEAGQQ